MSKTKAAYSQLERTHYEEIREQERLVRTIEYELEFAKQNYNEHKARLKTAQIELRELIHGGPDAQRKLPRMDHDDMEREPSESGPAWKRTPLDRVIGAVDLVNALKKAGLSTVGELADYTNSGRKLVSIKGVGEQGEAKVIEAMQRFWKEGVDEETEEGES